MGVNNRILTACLAFSVLFNFIVNGLVIFTVKSSPVFTGDYDTEDINILARIQRADFLGAVLKKQFEIDGGKNLPTIISQLAQNPNPQLWLSGEHGLLKMDYQSFTVLTREETEAVIAHELAHLILGHVPKGPNEARDIKKEIEADMFALDYVSPEALSGAIRKLSHDEEENRVRLKAIEEH